MQNKVNVTTVHYCALPTISSIPKLKHTACIIQHVCKPTTLLPSGRYTGRLIVGSRVAGELVHLESRVMSSILEDLQSRGPLSLAALTRSWHCLAQPATGLEESALRTRKTSRYHWNMRLTGRNIGISRYSRNQPYTEGQRGSGGREEVCFKT